jgi:putative restriction endonuclease
MTVADELARRLRLWSQVSGGDAGDADPSMLRSALVYGGAQGIWVDKKTTGALAEDGVTVSILHTGRHYADDLSDDGLIYHYPKTRRPPGRDAAEVQLPRTPARCRCRFSRFYLGHAALNDQSDLDGLSTSTRRAGSS